MKCPKHLFIYYYQKPKLNNNKYKKTNFPLLSKPHTLKPSPFRFHCVVWYLQSVTQIFLELSTPLLPSTASVQHLTFTPHPLTPVQLSDTSSVVARSGEIILVYTFRCTTVCTEFRVLKLPTVFLVKHTLYLFILLNPFRLDDCGCCLKWKLNGNFWSNHGPT